MWIFIIIIVMIIILIFIFTCVEFSNTQPDQWGRNAFQRKAHFYRYRQELKTWECLCNGEIGFNSEGGCEDMVFKNFTEKQKCKQCLKLLSEGINFDTLDEQDKLHQQQTFEDSKTTDRQKDYLINLGVDSNEIPNFKIEASELIDQLLNK